MDINTTLDCYGLLCPMPIIKVSQNIKKLQVGQVLELLSTDEGVKQDIAAWCKATGNELLDIKEEEEGVFKVYIKKLKD